MADTISIKEKAHQAREEKASALKGLFDSCFVPRMPHPIENEIPKENFQEESLIPRENPVPRENTQGENPALRENPQGENPVSRENTQGENPALRENPQGENPVSRENTQGENPALRGNPQGGNPVPRENTQGENPMPREKPTGTSNYISMLEIVGFTALGVLAVLKEEFPLHKGMLNITKFAKRCHSDRSAFVDQLRILEKKGIIHLGPPEGQGRQIEIIGYRENPMAPCSSSYLNNIKQLQLQLQNPQRENPAPRENPILDFPSDDFPLVDQMDLSDPSEDDETKDKLPPLPSWERARVVAQAEELFYVGIAAKVDVEAFSMQTVNLYERTSKERGKDYAGALFLLLLPKAKDNPTGYISSACKRGAEPTAASITRAQEMWELLDVLSKAPESEEIREQIKKAVDNDDTESLISLAEKQAQIKAALHMLSWEGTLEALIEKRDAFMTSLFEI